MARPKTNRNTVIKVGYALMPKTIEKIDRLSTTLQLSKSEVIEKAIEQYFGVLPIQYCSKCHLEFKSKELKDLCLSCEIEERT